VVTRIPRVLEVVALAAVFGLGSDPAPASPQSDAAPGWLTVELLYDGKPLATAATPELTCRDDGRMEWISCGLRDEVAPGAHTVVMRRPPAGTYTLHVEVDDHRDNPGRYPGDYDVFHRFVVAEGSPDVLRVPLLRLIRMTAPWDNERPLEGQLTREWNELPSFETPRFALPARHTMVVRWEPLVDGAEYDYVVQDMTGDHRNGPEIVRGRTAATTLTLELPPTPDGHYYALAVGARHQGAAIGNFFTHDAGAQSWMCRFRVVDRSLPWWGYAGAVVLLAGLWLLVRLPPEPRRWALATAAALGISLGGWLWHERVQDRLASEAAQRRQADREAEEKAESLRRGAAFLARFTAAVPKPDWWSSAPKTPLAIHNLGDLMSVWQTGGHSDDEGEQRFYKLAYQAILDHPEDTDLVAEALALMPYTEGDPERRLALLRFGLDELRDYDQRTDNCANCMAGDTTADVVRDFAEASISVGDAAAAIAAIDSLMRRRADEVSPYNLALTLQTRARARWELGDRTAARADLEEGLRRFPNGWQADELRATLARYQDEDR